MDGPWQPLALHKQHLFNVSIDGHKLLFSIYTHMSLKGLDSCGSIDANGFNIQSKQQVQLTLLLDHQKTRQGWIPGES